MKNDRSPIRICFTVDAAYAGGAEKYVSLLASGIDRDAFEPIVLARANPRLDDWCGRLAVSGVQVVRAPMDLPFRPRDAFSIWEELWLAAPHVVHINMPGPHDGQMGLLAPLARAAGSAAVVVTEHLPRVEPLWKRALVKRFSYSFVDRVLTVCRSNLAHLTERQGVPEYKTAAVYNGIPKTYGSGRDEWRETSRRSLGLRTSDIGIVFVGSLIERKGMGILLDALGGLRADGWLLFVIGSGEERGAYEVVAREKGLDERVRFLGDLPESEVEKALCACDLLVLPSFIEGMPYVVIEAMACSLPVVASCIDGIPEAAPDGEAGILVPPGDADALRAGVARLLGDESSRTRLGATGRRRFERLFTLERHVGEMESLYADLVGFPRGRGGDRGR
jgi:glycosyltransferase involved in cell wall biosynthesis